MNERTTRRKFMQTSVTAGAAAAFGAPLFAARKVRPGAPIKVACIGVGGRGSHLLGHILAIPNVHVVAICDLRPERIKAAQDRVVKAGQDKPDAITGGPYKYRELLNDPGIHCCVVATPCYWHSTMYVDLLNARMPFYGEKPLAITAWGVKRVQEAAKKNPGVCVQIGFQWGSHLARRDIMRRVREEGLIGELLYGEVQRMNGWDHHGGWYADRNKSGDWMLEQAVHEFNLIWMTVGKHPVAAYTEGRAGIIPGRNTTNYYTTILEYPGNLFIKYTHGWIQVPGFPGGGMHLYITGLNGAVDVMGAYAQLRKKPRGGQARIPGRGPGGDTREHMKNFFDAVRANDPSKIHCGIENGVAATYIGLVIRQSLEQKRKVTLQEALRDTRRPPVPPA